MTEELNTLDAFKLNPHSIYQSGNNQIICCLNMFECAAYQFNSAFVIQNLKKLKIICELSKEEVLSKSDQLIDFSKNGLIDSIKISLCFENISKALVLASGHLIHKVNRESCPELAAKQNIGPVLIEEFNQRWKDNSKIKTQHPDLKRTLDGLSFNTIKYSTILNNSEYNSRLNLDQRSLDFLIELHKFRNGLHLHNSLGFNLTNITYSQYSELSKAVADFSKSAKEKLPQLINLKSENAKPTFTVK